MRKAPFLKTRLFYGMCKYSIIQGWYQGKYGDYSPQAKSMERLADQFRDVLVQEFNK